ncbi:MAG: PqqD family protein [Acidimicrobiales bacterium]
MRSPRLPPALAPRRAPGGRLETHRGELFISDRERDVVVAVNKSAAALWELCDGATTVEEMVGAVCELSCIPVEQARDDVERTLEELAGAGLLSME